MTPVEYIAILFSECGFDTVTARAAYMTQAFNRTVKYSDELTSREKSLLINSLKDLKAGQRARSRVPGYGADE